MKTPRKMPTRSPVRDRLQMRRTSQVVTSIDLQLGGNNRRLAPRPPVRRSQATLLHSMPQVISSTAATTAATSAAATRAAATWGRSAPLPPGEDRGEDSNQRHSGQPGATQVKCYHAALAPIREPCFPLLSPGQARKCWGLAASPMPVPAQLLDQPLAAASPGPLRPPRPAAATP